MKTVVLMFSILGFSILAKAQSPKFGSSVTNKGFFAVGLGASYGSSRLLNTDGTYGSFAGPTFNLAMDVQLFNFGGSEVRAFSSYTRADLDGKELTSDKLQRNESIFGLKLFANSHFFLMAAIGNTQQTLNRAGVDYRMSHKITAMGLGYDFQMSDNWYLGVHGTYKSGPIANANNPILTQNSFWEAGDLGLVLTWSPPSTILNFSK